MNHPSPTGPVIKPSQAVLRNSIALGVLAALFAGGLFLLYSLIGGDSVPLAQQRASVERSPLQPEPEPQPEPPREPATASAQAAAQTDAGAQPTTGMPDASAQQAAAPGSEPAPTRPPAPAADLARTADVQALQARVDALTAELTTARGRLDALTERAAAFADTAARIEILEADIAAARAAADAAAAQAAEAAEAAQRIGRLTADYARLGARFTPAGVLVRLDETALAFAPGTAELPASAAAELAAIAAFLRRHPRQQGLLRGHTDATGGAAANQALSEARAAAVRDALVDLGVSAERLRIEGVGAAEPIADNASAEGRRRNRRVDILLQAPVDSAG